ncbi:hypothetical protein BKA57DRAFT_464925 [Linnemannia elongata]|nr:hypothetical protein BKA57DRAFT_464925 [Linnemannia elongata]KAK5815048.1 hypothetical protein F5H01DRAFT_344836 [Linnemannia elongata]
MPSPRSLFDGTSFALFFSFLFFTRLLIHTPTLLLSPTHSIAPCPCKHVFCHTNATFLGSNRTNNNKASTTSNEHKQTKATTTAKADRQTVHTRHCKVRTVEDALKTRDVRKKGEDAFGWN